MQHHGRVIGVRGPGAFGRWLRNCVVTLKAPTCLVVVASLAAGCAQADRSSPQAWATNTSKFPPSQMEVPASPYVATGRKISRGGGVYKIGTPYKVAGKWYVPRHDPHYDATGMGSWYGDDFHGRKTANGEIFDKHALTAAHPTLPLPSYAYVTNLENNRTVLVRINDRGPYAGGRIIDLSHFAARHLGFDQKGLARMRVRYAGRAPLNGDDSRERRYLASQSWVHRNARVASSRDDNLTTGAVARR